MSRLSSERPESGARIPIAGAAAVIVSVLLSACAGPVSSVSEVGIDAPPVTQAPPAATNAAPVVTTSNVSVELPTDHTNLSGSAIDDGLPAGSSLSFTWELVNGPSGLNNGPGAKLGTTTAQNASVRFVGGPGDYVFNLKASDGALTGASTLHVTVKPNPNLYPVPPTSGNSGWTAADPADEHMEVAKLDEAKAYSLSAGITGNESGYIIRHGRLVYSWGSPTQRYEMKSTTKSIGGLALLLALDEEKLALSDAAAPKIPGFGADPAVDTSPVADGSLADITILQLATHTAGFSKSDRTNLQLLYEPGTTWSYSDQGLNWLADALTQTYSQDLNLVMSSRFNTTLGVRTTDLTWRDSAFRSHTLNVNGVAVPRREFASGMAANVNAMARFGLLMLRKGVWVNQSLLSNAVVELAHQPPAASAATVNAKPEDFSGATTNYGVLWWTNATGQMAGVPRDAYWAWGLHETFIIVVPSLDLIVARAGDHPWHPQPEEWNANYSVLEPFLTPIVESITP
jgi:CubicO group peptidase (beta-lactamase class C family)